jgi:hypothetical protein
MFKMALERHQMIDLLTELLDCSLTELETLQRTTIPIEEIVAEAKSEVFINGRASVGIEDLVDAMFSLGLDRIHSQIYTVHQQRIHELRGIESRMNRGKTFDGVDLLYLSEYSKEAGESPPTISRDTYFRMQSSKCEVHFKDEKLAKFYNKFYEQQLENFYELTGFHILT